MSTGNVQFYDFNLTAGGSQWLPVSGAFYRIISSTGPVSIREDVGTSVGPISAGQGMRNRDFGGLTIVDKSGAANKGTIIIAGSDFVDDRITGEVSTIDGAKARSIAGAAFAAYGYQGAVAAQNSTVQLWNNGTGSKNLIVNDISVLSNSPSPVAVSIHLVAGMLATQIQPGRPKKVYGADSACATIRAQAIAQAINSLRSFLMPVSTTMGWRPTEPLVIPPNTGVIVQNVNPNIDVGASFDWWEEAA